MIFFYYRVSPQELDIQDEMRYDSDYVSNNKINCLFCKSLIDMKLPIQIEYECDVYYNHSSNVSSNSCNNCNNEPILIQSYVQNFECKNCKVEFRSTINNDIYHIKLYGVVEILINLKSKGIIVIPKNKNGFLFPYFNVTEPKIWKPSEIRRRIKNNKVFL